jgi:hypothetical protein
MIEHELIYQKLPHTSTSRRDTASLNDHVSIHIDCNPGNFLLALSGEIPDFGICKNDSSKLPANGHGYIKRSSVFFARYQIDTQQLHL